MYELFAALFSGIAIGGSSVYHKAVNKDLRNQAEAIKDFDSKITSYVKEDKLRKQYFNDKFAALSGDEIEKELSFVLGKEWRSVLKNCRECRLGVNHANYSAKGFNDANDVAFNILLSHYGIIPFHHVNGYNINAVIPGVPVGERRSVAKNACRVIQKNLQARHGNNLFLCEETNVSQLHPAGSIFNEELLLWNVWLKIKRRSGQRFV